MDDVLRVVLDADVTASPAVASIASLRTELRALAERFPASIDRAIAGGFFSDRVGFAFAAGYQAALSALVSGDATETRALCATEERGAHPRAIATRLDAREEGGFTLNGKKKWATFSPLADVLLVVAKAGEQGEGAGARPLLRVVRVRASAPGVAITPMPETPFAPEIPHAEVSFERVAVAPTDVLDGDGYDRYVKPFRTIEDVHVLGALLGHVMRVARTSDWSHASIEDLAFAIVSIRALALADARAKETHVALAGAFRHTRALLSRCEPEWQKVDASTRERWQRDRALLDVAEGARKMRLEAAWRASDG